MILYIVLMRTNIEYIVKSVINYVSKDIKEIILNQEHIQIIFIKEIISKNFI